MNELNNDLISRSELKKAIEQGEGFSWNSHGKDDLCVRKKYIDNAPTVDTTCPNCDSGYAQGYSDGYLKGKEDRPQGEWIYKKFDAESGISRSYWCSNCGEPKSQWCNDFCQRCGADMRKGGAE